MAVEAELIYRARNSGGREDAAYVIRCTAATSFFQVTVAWGSWERYLTAPLQSKQEYTGTSRASAQAAVIAAANKRLQRGYELQAHLSTFPTWYDLARSPAAVANITVIAEVHTAAPSPKPEPLPTERVRHSRRIDL